MLGLRPGRWSSSLVQCLVIGGIVLGCGAVASAEDVARVEEDWELVVGVPDANSSSPQVVTVISPTGDVSSLHGRFLVNHQTEPSFESGGLQLQVWDGSVNKSERRFPNSARLQIDNEVIRWTQSMEIVEGGLEFAIANGVSGTWEEFGKWGYFKATIESSLENLNDHSPAVSEANSGVVLAKHRVASLRLLETRRYTAAGGLIEE